MRSAFAAGDPLFLDQLFACRDHAGLATFAEAFYGDLRPWARQQLRAYVLDGCDRPHHRPLVKRLFKAAERDEDDALLGLFLVAFDRMVRHELALQRRYVWRERTWKKVPVPVRTGGYPGRLAASWQGPKAKWRVVPRFSLATRQYLRRRALRYFRKLGRRDPARFRAALAEALPLYEDADLGQGTDLVDSWSLLQLLYYDSPVLRWDARGIDVRRGRSLAELEPAPMHADVWREQLPLVLELIGRARSRFVRRTFIRWARAEYALADLDLEALLPLLRSPHPEVQLFAVQQLRKARGLQGLAAAEWLRLLRLEDAMVLQTAAGLAREHVRPDRVSLEEAVELACLRPAPVAELGLAWVREKVDASTPLAPLLPLRHAEAPPVREEAARWLCERVLAAGDTSALRELIDARHTDVRALALPLLEAPPFADATALWAALAESPYPEVRELLLRHLDARRSALDPTSVRHLWATTLLGVHRGSRSKRVALKQIADRVIAGEGELLPLLALSLRSVRAPERRAALAAITRAALARPAFRADVEAAVPELGLPAAEEARP